MPAFTLGAVAGAWVGAEVYQSLDLRWLPAIIGVLILFMTWVPLPQISRGGQLALLSLGFYQTGLGMIAGATGPVGAAVLLQRNTGRDWLVVNTAVYMSLNHALRLGAYAAMGFGFAAWWLIRSRQRLGQVNFVRLFRWLVTLLALRMVALSFLQ